MTDTSRRIPQLDGLRGLAILLVLVWHFIIWPVSTHHTVLSRAVTNLGSLAWSGVDLFFVLSGFLIGGILVDAKGSGRYFKTFYLRRVFRILPIYFSLVILFLLLWTAATGLRTGLAETVGRPMPWFLYFTFTQNFWLASHSWDFIYLAATWSLAVEEQFYLFLPAMIRALPRQWLMTAAVTAALASTAIRSLLYLHYGPSWGNAAYVLIFTRADALMLGVVCALLLRDPRWKSLLARNQWLAGASCAVFGLGILVLMYKRGDWERCRCAPWDLPVWRCSTHRY
jgi:peptidoglycan/LPS O-acetylase OafA/YrhL